MENEQTPVGENKEKQVIVKKKRIKKEKRSQSVWEKLWKNLVPKMLPGFHVSMDPPKRKSAKR